MNALLGFLGDCYRKSGAERRGEIGFLVGLEIGKEEWTSDGERGLGGAPHCGCARYTGLSFVYFHFPFFFFFFFSFPNKENGICLLFFLFQWRNNSE